MNPTYQVLIRNKDQEILAEIENARSIRFSERLNNYGRCTFTLPVNDPKMEHIIHRINEVEIRRNGVTVWAGELATESGQLFATSSNRISIYAYTFLEMLNSRYTGPFRRFDNVDQGTILQTLVSESQAQTDGNLGFTFGTVEATKNRDREYSNFNIMEAFINMANVIDGPDFDFKFNKEIDIKAHVGTDRSNIAIFDWKRNFKQVIYTRDFTHPANRGIVIGAGFGAAQALGFHVDTASRTAHRLREQRVSEPDVLHQGTLEDKAQEVVRKYKQPLLSLQLTKMPNMEPNFPTLRIGDSCRVRLREGNLNINNRFRVYEHEVSIGDTGEEEVTYNVALI